MTPSAFSGFSSTPSPLTPSFGFGQQPAAGTAPAFGATDQTPSTGGGFGGNSTFGTPQQATTGATSAFGTPQQQPAAATSAFGTQQPTAGEAPAAFGTESPSFGFRQQPAASSAPAPFSLGGTSTAAPAFGTASSSAFGQGGGLSFGAQPPAA